MSELIHYGTPRHSGRYPWGSGKNPYQHENWYEKEKELKAQGLSEKERAEALGLSVNQLRAKKTIYKNEIDKKMLAEAIRLRDAGYSNVEIGKQLNVGESRVRYLLKQDRQERIGSTEKVARVLKEQLKEHPYLDVGKGVELQLNCSSTQLKTALEMLREEGYNVHNFDVPQVSDPNHKTPMVVLTSGDITKKEVYQNKEKISSPEGVYFEDYGNIVREIKPVVSLDSKRIKIRYSEDGGELKDGVIELRPGVQDISLGNNKYAQVRIAVDGTHYLKGMAMYTNEKMPDGIDIIFNTNKSKSVPMISDDKDNSVLKPLKNDPSSPFGAITRQHYYISKDGEEHQSPINIVNDDSDWDKWSKNLSSQFLSKQRPALAKRQLDLAYKQKAEELDKIISLENPTVKRKLLLEFSDECDSAAVHLKAAAFPRQGTFVILPVNSLKETEVYAPKYDNGEEVVLVRYPHAGKFEIPRLIVNNNNKNAKDILGASEHAIGINAKVAKQLSGADFDGDTVVLIPTRGQQIASRGPLPELKDFDPSHAYPAFDGMKRVGKGDGFNKQTEMGKISNLITDMTIRGADDKEIARAVRHSMVVIDAEKHNLNWKQSYSDNNIAELKEKYQGGKDRGASTLISRAKHEERIPERKQLYSNGGIDPKTGKKVYINTDRSYEKSKKIKDKNGNYIYDENGNIKREYKTGKYEQATTKIFSMARVDDAYELSSGTKIENVYADHANKLKALANQARKLYLSTPKLKQNASAKKTYSKEVSDLESKLRIALRNAPLERQAQLIAGKIVAEEKKHNPDIRGDKDALKKARTRAIIFARDKAVGTKRTRISLTDREWEAIQAGAISDSKLSEILRFADPDEIKKRATPKNNYISVTPAALSMARSWLNAGFTQSEVANELGISVSTLSKALKEGV